MVDELLSSTEVIHDLQKLVGANAVDQTSTVCLGAVLQVVSIRGRSRTNPVLLFIHGGPGTPLAPTGWMWQRPVEEFFTVVHYDQRAAGRSYRLCDADQVRATMTPDQYVSDAAELIEWLQLELGVDRVIVAGHSWGTVIATKLAQSRPELVSAYLGIGQIVDFYAGEQASYTWFCQEAKRRGDDGALAELESLAPYPGKKPLELEKFWIERKWIQRYGGFAAGRSDCDYFTHGDVTSLAYHDENRASSTDGNSLSLEVVLPQLLEVDFTHMTEFAVPVVQFLGRYDQMTPSRPVARWMEEINAPYAAVEWFEDSAHMPMYEEPGHFLTALIRHLQPVGNV